MQVVKFENKVFSFLRMMRNDNLRDYNVFTIIIMVTNIIRNHFQNYKYPNIFLRIEFFLTIYKNIGYNMNKKKLTLVHFYWKNHTMISVYSSHFCVKIFFANLILMVLQKLTFLNVSFDFKTIFFILIIKNLSYLRSKVIFCHDNILVKNLKRKSLRTYTSEYNK